jgi:hypothetical protein
MLLKTGNYICPGFTKDFKPCCSKPGTRKWREERRSFIHTYIYLYFSIISSSIKACPKADMVAHACNPSYLGGKDKEDQGSRLDRVKKLARPHLNKKLGRWHSPVTLAIQEV